MASGENIGIVKEVEETSKKYKYVASVADDKTTTFNASLAVDGDASVTYGAVPIDPAVAETFYAYYPYENESGNKLTVETGGYKSTIKTDQSGLNFAANDILFAKTEKDEGVNDVEFEFKHFLSILEFDISFVGYMEDAGYSLGSVTLSKTDGYKMYNGVSYNYDGTFKSVGEPSNDNFNFKVADNKATLFVNPTDAAADHKQGGKLTFTKSENDDKTYEIDFSFSPEQGKVHKYPVEVGLYTVTFGTLSIGGWGDGTEVDNGVLDYAYDIVKNGEIYEIYTAAGLQAFGNIVNTGYSSAPDGLNYKNINFTSLSQNASADAQLMKDIDLTGITWIPIKDYAGTFDGNDKTISNLTIDSTETIVGLFATNNGTIQDFNVSGSVTVTNAESRVGMIAGDNLGTISNCTTSGSVTNNRTGTKDASTGGIVGENGNASNLNATVVLCVNNATVNGSQKVGGIVGLHNKGYIINCGNSSTGFVTDSATGTGDQVGTGGIAGCADESTFILSCYNQGAVTSGSANVGGILGCNGSTSKINGCYSTGTITGTANVGGIAGFGGDDGIASCYYKENCVTVGEEKKSLGIGDLTEDKAKTISMGDTAMQEDTFATTLTNGQDSSLTPSGVTLATWAAADNAYPTFTTED